VEFDVLTEMNVRIMATWRILLQATYPCDGVSMFLLSAGTWHSIHTYKSVRCHISE